MNRIKPKALNKVETEVSRCDTISIPDNEMVKVIEAGHIFHICYSEVHSYGSSTHKLNKDYYSDINGEIHKYEHYTDKSDDSYAVKKSLKQCRDLICVNFSDTDKVLFCTLTYREEIDSDGKLIPMRDVSRVKKDLTNFRNRLNRYYSRRFNRMYKQKDNKPKIDKYLYTVAPQASGSWHIHMLLHFTKPYPYIPYEDFYNIWGNGYGYISRVETDIYEVSQYMTIRQKDLDITDNIPDFDTTSFKVKKVKLFHPSGKRIVKKYLIDGSLKYYPPNMRLYRSTQHLKKPIKRKMTYAEAIDIYGDYTNIYSESYEIKNMENGDVINHVRNDTYRKKKDSHISMM